jgi:hypothetical protein
MQRGSAQEREQLVTATLDFWSRVNATYCTWAISLRTTVPNRLCVRAELAAGQEAVHLSRSAVAWAGSTGRSPAVLAGPAADGGRCARTSVAHAHDHRGDGGERCARVGRASAAVRDSYGGVAEEGGGVAGSCGLGGDHWGGSSSSGGPETPGARVARSQRAARAGCFLRRAGRRASFFFVEQGTQNGSSHEGMGKRRNTAARSTQTQLNQ